MLNASCLYDISQTSQMYTHTFFFYQCFKLFFNPTLFLFNLFRQFIEKNCLKSVIDKQIALCQFLF